MELHFTAPCTYKGNGAPLDPEQERARASCKRLNEYILLEAASCVAFTRRMFCFSS